MLRVTARAVERELDSIEEELLVLRLSFLAVGRLLFPTDHEISDETVRLSSRAWNMNVDDADDAESDAFLPGPSRSPRLDSADGFFLDGIAEAREELREAVDEKNLGEKEFPPASGEVDQATDELVSSLGVRVVLFCHRIPLEGEAVAADLLLLLLLG